MGRRVVQQLHPVRVTSPLMLLVVVTLLVAVLAESQDYYALLGVNREATTREIRRAFKKLALTMHPDKNPVSYSEKLNFKKKIQMKCLLKCTENLDL